MLTEPTLHDGSLLSRKRLIATAIQQQSSYPLRSRDPLVMVAWMACGRLPAREAPEVRADVSLWCANCTLG
jgi:hypothetical protein